MAGTIVVDRLESDASYASSINVASPLVVSNTITMVGGGATVASNLTVKVGETSRLELGVVNLSDGYIQYANNSGSGKMTIGMDSAGGSFAINAFSGGYEDRFIVTNQGYVTKPYQPAASIRFEAGSYTGGTIRDATFSSLTATDYNIGGHMNTSTGVFTCPVAGMYLCNTIWYNGNGNNGYIGVITAKNGSTYGLFWYNDDQGYGDDSVMDSRIVQASAGDTLRVQLYGISSDSTPTIQFQVYYLG
jgi:hypothetical protein